MHMYMHTHTYATYMLEYVDYVTHRYIDTYMHENSLHTYIQINRHRQ